MNYLHVHEDDVPWSDAEGALNGLVRTKLLLDGGPETSRGLRLEFVEIAPGAELPLHAHDQWETDWVLSGEADVRLGGSRFELDTHGSLVVPGGMPHSLAAKPDAPLVYACTYGTENRGSDIKAVPVDDAPETLEPAGYKTWIRWDEAEDYWSSEKSKGMRIRVRRLSDLDIPGCELVAGIGDIDPDTHYTLHYHDQVELYYIPAGEGIVLVDGDEVNVSKGSVIYINGGVVHGADNRGTEPVTVYYVYGTENSGPAMNWTAVEEVYGRPRPR